MAQDLQKKTDIPELPPTGSLPQAAGGNPAHATPPPLPPPLPTAAGQSAVTAEPSTTDKVERSKPQKSSKATEVEAESRRVARRRPAGPVRNRIAANDDAPSIGGLIYALEQKPSNRPFMFAWIASGVWAAIGGAYSWTLLSSELSQGLTVADVLMRPAAFMVAAAVFIPIAVLWLLALLAWRAEELRLRSSTMTEVAIRLAEPDRMAEQSVASLGQAVRRQVSFMNDAVSRALGRAGELEALVHSEVAALERSYEENERRIRALIQELSGERHALLNTSDKVSDTLRSMGAEVPALIEKLSEQQVKLAHIIEGAGDNLNSLESAIRQSSVQLESTVTRTADHFEGSIARGTQMLEGSLGKTVDRLEGTLSHGAQRLETTLGDASGRMETVLEGYANGLGEALGARTEQMQAVLEDFSSGLASALSARTDNLQTVFEEYTRALDTTLSNRTQIVDNQLIERTKALDSAFSERLRLFDESIMRSTLLIDAAVGEKQRALGTALEEHARNFRETVQQQTVNLDESLMHGINAVRRSSENITRQSLKAIEGLANQSDMLKNVTENLLGQISSVTNRFESQGQQIMRAAGSLETVNQKIDQTLQHRYNDLNTTLTRISGKADEFGRFIEGYSSTLEGSLTEAELRARAAAEELRASTETRQREALANLERLKGEADAESQRQLDELRRRFSSVSTEVTQQLGSLSSRFDAANEEVRQRAARAAAELAEEQAQLRRELERLPAATRESADAMRRALGDQLKALEQLSSFTSRAAQERDVSPPVPKLGSSNPPSSHSGAATSSAPGTSRAIASLSSTLQQELHSRQQPQPHSGLVPSAPPPPSAVSAPPPQQTVVANYAPVAPAGGAPDGGRDNWKLGDLLKRASFDEPHMPTPAPTQPLPTPFALNVDVIARALDPATASAIWSRFRQGQRGIMVRSIYTNEGRATFDEVSRRYKTDPELKRTIDRYLADFERILKDAEQRDPSGRLVQNHFVSDTGRVYLFLSHASGRLS